MIRSVTQKNETAAQDLRTLEKRTARGSDRDARARGDRPHRIRTPRLSRPRSHSERAGGESIAHSRASPRRAIEFNPLKIVPPIKRSLECYYDDSYQFSLRLIQEFVRSLQRPD